MEMLQELKYWECETLRTALLAVGNKTQFCPSVTAQQNCSADKGTTKNKLTMKHNICTELVARKLTSGEVQLVYLALLSGIHHL